MKLILSRKGVDSGSGGCASPILDGRPISLPIPTQREGVNTTYRALGLAEHFERATRGKRSGDEACHEDPMFGDGLCGFGQTGAAQSHLAKHSVGVGDVFLFFGLFSDPDGRKRHHRIFGYLAIEEVCALGATPTLNQSPSRMPRPHPHVIGAWNVNNTLYVGTGCTAQRASDALRLSADETSVSIWTVPPWLKTSGLTYHAATARWLDGNRLASVGRGQEFITTVDTAEARNWLDSIIEEIKQ
jgi:hypothetical protein